MQISDPNPHLTLFLSVWAAFGPLLGIFIGNFLTGQWQRRQWLKDRRNEEFRELITILTESFGEVGNPKYVFGPTTPEDIFRQSDASMKCFCAIANRIYIAEDVKQMNLIKQWSEAVDEFRRLHDPEKWGARLRRMTDQIVEAATRSAR